MPGFKLFDLSGRVALVTGGSKGLGKSMATAYAEVGADVVITSRHEDELKATSEAIASSTGRKVVYRVADMSRREDAEALAKSVLEEMGRVDVLVNNAGSNIPSLIDEITDADWDRIVELNLSSCMVLTRALVPQMKERKWGRIIHISSVLGVGGKKARNAYCATKAGLIGLSRASALDLGPFGVTVNCISPGPFLTDLPMSVLSDEEKKEFSDRTAMGRWGEPDELAGTALLLGTDAGSYITGETIVVDGGVVAHTL